MLAVKHYQKCKAVNRFPDDGTVASNARIIMLAEESAQELQHLNEVGQAQSLLALMGVTRARR